MNLFSKVNTSKENFLSILVALLPLSFIAGNLIINFNLILLILFSLILFNKNVFTIRFYILDKLLFFYFFLIIFTAFINDYEFYRNDILWRGYFPTTIKSFFFLKYLLLYLVLRFLVEKNFLNLKYFFISCLFASLFVCFDIFYQFFNGKDIFGFLSETSGRKLGGPFGDELIAGGYIQRFSIFAFFTLPLFYSKDYKKAAKYLIPVFFIIFFVGIIMSGNRMPLLLFLLAVSLIIIFQKQTRKFLVPFVIIFSLIFFLLISVNTKIKNNFLNFYVQISNMKMIIVGDEFNNKNIPQYFKEFSTFYDTWLLNKYIGGGIKNFRYYCHERPNIDENSNFICNMHPHNYYLEILTETGLFGFIILISILLSILYLSFYNKYFTRSSLSNNNLIIPFIFLFIVEIFPLKSTGSFFTTGNTTYLFLIIGILVGIIRSENRFEKHT